MRHSWSRLTWSSALLPLWTKNFSFMFCRSNVLLYCAEGLPLLGLGDVWVKFWLCHLQRMKMICSSLCSQFNIVAWVWMQGVHVPQPRFQHGDPGTCLMAPGNQSRNEIKDQQYGLVNAKPRWTRTSFQECHRLLCFSWRALPLLCKNIRQGNLTSLVITRVCALKYL